MLRRPAAIVGKNGANFSGRQFATSIGGAHFHRSFMGFDV
jgi:hypothetical protein